MWGFNDLCLQGRSAGLAGHTARGPGEAAALITGPVQGAGSWDTCQASDGPSVKPALPLVEVTGTSSETDSAFTRLRCDHRSLETLAGWPRLCCREQNPLQSADTERGLQEAGLMDAREDRRDRLCRLIFQKGRSKPRGRSRAQRSGCLLYDQEATGKLPA